MTVQKTSYKEIGPYLGLGVQLAATIIIMIYIGKWLDEKFNTGSLYTLIGAVFGIFAGLYNLIKMVLSLEKRRKEE